MVESTQNFHVTKGQPYSWWAISLAELKFRVSPNTGVINSNDSWLMRLACGVKDSSTRKNISTGIFNANFVMPSNTEVVLQFETTRCSPMKL